MLQSKKTMSKKKKFYKYSCKKVIIKFLLFNDFPSYFQHLENFHTIFPSFNQTFMQTYCSVKCEIFWIC